MKAEQAAQLQLTPKRTPEKRRNISYVAVTTCLAEEEERRREKLCKVLAEMKIDLISLSESIPQQLMKVLSLLLDGFAVADDDMWYTTLKEH